MEENIIVNSVLLICQNLQQKHQTLIWYTLKSNGLNVMTKTETKTNFIIDTFKT